MHAEQTGDQVHWGTLFEPLLVKSTNKVEVETAIHPGWNWVSLNVMDEDKPSVKDAFSSIDNAHLTQLKAHGLDKVYRHRQEDEGNTYVWSDHQTDDLVMTTMYQVLMNTPTADDPDPAPWTLTHIGVPAHADSLGIPIKKGWNELG